MKYADARIESVRTCGYCDGAGAVPTGAGGQEQSCMRCDGTGEQRTPVLYDGEPFLLVRGKDVLAPQVVTIYQTLYAVANGRSAGCEFADLVSLRARIEAWQQANPGLVKTPD